MACRNITGTWCPNNGPGNSGKKKVVDPALFMKEIERELNVSFSSKFYFQGTSDGKWNSFHNRLTLSAPEGPAMSVKVNGMKYQRGIDKHTNEQAQVLVEKGVDVQIATKLIECAYGLNGEQKAKNIVVITGDGDFLPALTCARAAPDIGDNVHVIGGENSMSQDLRHFVHKGTDGSSAHLERCIERSMRGSGENSGKIMSKPAAKMVANCPSFLNGRNGAKEEDIEIKIAGGLDHYKEPPKKRSRSCEHDSGEDMKEESGRSSGGTDYVKCIGRVMQFEASPICEPSATRTIRIDRDKASKPMPNPFPKQLKPPIKSKQSSIIKHPAGPLNKQKMISSAAFNPDINRGLFGIDVAFQQWTCNACSCNNMRNINSCESCKRPRK